MPVLEFDQKRACMRWIYAQRNLGLPLSTHHIERILAELEMQIDEVPDELVDETVLQFGMGSFLICEDCGTPGIWPGSQFDVMRTLFCHAEIAYRRTGQWPQVDSVYLEFNRAYLKRVKARKDGLDPGIFYGYTHSPRDFGNGSQQPQTTDDERPF